MLSNTLATIVVCILLAAAVGGAVLKLLRDKKKGNCACGCNCNTCAMHGECHK